MTIGMGDGVMREKVPRCSACSWFSELMFISVCTYTEGKPFVENKFISLNVKTHKYSPVWCPKRGKAV